MKKAKRPKCVYVEFRMANGHAEKREGRDAELIFATIEELHRRAMTNSLTEADRIRSFTLLIVNQILDTLRSANGGSP